MWIGEEGWGVGGEVYKKGRCIRNIHKDMFFFKLCGTKAGIFLGCDAAL